MTAKAYKIPGGETTDSAHEVKQAWSNLPFVWHLDQHNGNQRLRTLSEEKAKQINEDYEFLKDHKPQRTTVNTRNWNGKRNGNGHGNEGNKRK